MTAERVRHTGRRQPRLSCGFGRCWIVIFWGAGTRNRPLANGNSLAYISMIIYVTLHCNTLTLPFPFPGLYYYHHIPPPNSFLLGFSMQPGCVRLSVGGCVGLLGPLSLVVSFSLAEVSRYGYVGDFGDLESICLSILLNVSQSGCWRLSSLAICFPRIPFIPSHSIHYATVHSITLRIGS